MKTKAVFAFIFIAFLSGLVLSQTQPANSKGSVTLSYSLPSKLNWVQDTGEQLFSDTQLFTLGAENPIRLSSIQIGNPNIWEKFATMDVETIYREIVSGKKVVHQIAGYKNWTANKSMYKKSDKEIVFEMTGNYIDGKEKKFFSEKHYITPYGFIISSLDWTDKSDAQLAGKAQNDFKNMAFKSEIR